MGYQIQYAPVKSINRRTKYKHKNVVRILLVATIVTILCTFMASDTLREYIFPYDPVAMNRATEQMVETIKEGKDIKDAVAAFCTEVISSALQK